MAWKIGGDYTKFGLCYCSRELFFERIITDDEHEKLDRFLFENRPSRTKNRKFFLEKWEINEEQDHWWPLSDKQVRLEFLESLVRK